jgi:four helix bundle protein
MPAQKQTSIEGLRIYQASRALEDHIYELVKTLPQEEFYRLGNDLRRSSAAVSHYITESHQRYSYSLRLEALHLARSEAEYLKALLIQCAKQQYAETTSLQDGCNGVIKQAWGLISYLKQRQQERQTAMRISAADDLVAARSS